MQVVIFKIGEEQFAVETGQVQSICDMMNITKVPKASSYIKGLINLRGIIITVLNINLILGIEESSCKDQNIIILNLKDESIGITVDSVEEVLDIEDRYIEKVMEKEKPFLKGIINLKDRIITLIDLDKIEL